MNAIVKILPLILNSKLVKGKKRWASLAIAVISAYQLFSLDGLGAKWGVPSYDTFYQEPRDVLITRVEAASEAQEETANEFKTALEQFKSITNFNGGDLEKKFNTLNSAFKDSENAAENVRSRVDRVVIATNKLLSEWREELNQYHDASFKQRAVSQFDETRLQAEKLIAAMRKAEEKTTPVLSAFRDQVLFLKHNLNMQAIGSLELESTEIQQNVSDLIKDMEVSITEARTFLEELKR